MFENLMELNSNLDEIIKKATVETDRMEFELNEKLDDALDKLGYLFEEIKMAYAKIYEFYGNKGSFGYKYLTCKAVKRNEWNRMTSSCSFIIRNSLVPELEVEIVGHGIGTDNVKYRFVYNPNYFTRTRWGITKDLGMTNIDSEILQAKEIIAINLDYIIDEITKDTEEKLKKMIIDKAKKQKAYQNHLDEMLEKLEEG